MIILSIYNFQLKDVDLIVVKEILEWFILKYPFVKVVIINVQLVLVMEIVKVAILVITCKERVVWMQQVVMLDG